MRDVDDEVLSDPFELLEFGMFAVQFLYHALEVLAGVVELSPQLTQFSATGTVQSRGELALGKFTGVFDDIG